MKMDRPRDRLTESLGKQEHVGGMGLGWDYKY